MAAVTEKEDDVLVLVTKWPPPGKRKKAEKAEEGTFSPAPAKRHRLQIAIKQAAAAADLFPGSDVVFGSGVPVVTRTKWLQHPLASKIANLNPKTHEGFQKRKWSNISLLIYVYYKKQLWGYVAVPALSGDTGGSFRFEITIVEKPKEGTMMELVKQSKAEDWSISWFLVAPKRPDGHEDDRPIVVHQTTSGEKERCEIKPVRDYIFVIFRAPITDGPYINPWFIRSAMMFKPQSTTVVISFEVAHWQAWGDPERDERALYHLCRLLTV